MLKREFKSGYIQISILGTFTDSQLQGPQFGSELRLLSVSHVLLMFSWFPLGSSHLSMPIVELFMINYPSV